MTSWTVRHKWRARVLLLCLGFAVLCCTCYAPPLLSSSMGDIVTRFFLQKQTLVIAFFYYMQAAVGPWHSNFCMRVVTWQALGRSCRPLHSPFVFLLLNLLSLCLVCV
jgi:hypothetical protein